MSNLPYNQSNAGEYLKTMEKAQKRELATIYVVGTILATLLILAVMAGYSEGAEVTVQRETLTECLDPKNLPADLKKSYEVLKKSGHDVKINCYPKQPGLTAEQLRAIESLR